jgi:beta-glucosidase
MMRHLSRTFRNAAIFALLGFGCVSLDHAQEKCSKTLTEQQVDAQIDALIDGMSVKEQVAQLQDRAPGIRRLGIPAYNWWNEGLHGIARNGYATVFPQAIGLAATFDPRLLREVGDTVSTEARAKFNVHPRGDSPRYGGLTVWSPNINIFRDPRWGRGQETYGEDPFLTGALGSAFVTGVQGTDAFFLKADATPKHFVAHSGPESGRDGFNAVVSAHDLEDTYLQAFHAVVRDAHASALMCSYNAINGTPSCADAGLLQGKVRESWRFNGYVVSDCDAVGNITDYQHYTQDKVHGAADALNAGVDLDCGNSYLPLEDSLKEKLVTEATIHQALHRLMRARFQLGALTTADCSPFDTIAPAEVDSAKHRALSLRAAEESIVLLKNDGTLPLKAGLGHIAVIGPTADLLSVLEANYHGTASRPVTPLDGLSKTFAGAHYAQGSLLAAGVAAPIPRTALRTGPGAGDAAGLKAEYFAKASFDGAAAVHETVPKVDLDLDRVGPSTAITSPQFAARWSGYLVPPGAGDYKLHVQIERCWDCTTHDHFRLYVDDKLAIDNDGSHAEPNSVTLRCEDASPHAVRLELIHSGEDEGISLQWQPPAQVLLDEAVATASHAGTIVAFVGLSPDLEGEALQIHLDGFAGGDRETLELPASQRALLERLQALKKPMVIVLMSGSAVSLNAEEQRAGAIVEAWYSGEEGGDAIANVLRGETNPSGRLPVTFYHSVADLPPFSDYSMAHRTYRYFDGPVLYPFGFGLSYTNFQYSDVRVERADLKAGEPLTVTAMVKNTGGAAGAEVSELYLVPPVLAGNPRLTLQGVERTMLQPGESKRLTFTLRPSQMSFVDAAGKRAIRAGSYRILIGSVQPAVVGAGGVAFTIHGESAEPFSVLR